MQRKVRKKTRTIPLSLIITVIVLIILVSWGSWTFYHSESTVRWREQVKLRNACFDDVKYRYQLYVEQNGKKNPDGSFSLSEREQQYIDNIRKEEYRQCSELFNVN